MENQTKAPQVDFFPLPFDLPENKTHQTMTALNTSGDRLYVTDSSIDLPSVFVARLELDGAVDAEFNKDNTPGWVSQELDVGGLPYTPAGLVPRLGGGVIAGLVSSSTLGLAGFTEKGALDPSFGTGGIVSYTPSNPVRHSDDIEKDGLGQASKINGSAGVLAPAPGGKFYGLVGGRFTVAGTLVRFEADGTLDESFGNRGEVVVKNGDKNTGAVAVIAMGASHVVVAGTSGNRLSGYELFLARYDNSGKLDSGFGNSVPKDGFARFDWRTLGLANSPFQMEFNHATAHQDGGLSAAGYVMDSGTSGLIVRVDPFGELDGNFNAGKPVLLRLDKDTDFRTGGAAVTFAGQLLVAGGIEDRVSGYAREPFIARFTRDGKLDTSFTETGWIALKPFSNKASSLWNLIISTAPPADVIYAAGDGGPDDGPASHQGFAVKIVSPVLGKNGGK